MRRKSLLQIALIIAVGFTVYANSLHSKFLWDDEFLVKDNIYIKSPSNIAHIFTGSIGMGAGRDGVCYRPLQMLTYMFDYSIWKLNVFGYHITNILLHILAALAIYWLVSLLFSNNLLSFITSLLFLVHPIHTEAISYISGRADPLSSLFILLCFIFYVKQASIKSQALYALILLSYVLALLSKESSLILPLLLLLYNFTFKKKCQAKELFSLAGISFIYIILRITVLKFTPTDANPTSALFQRIPGFFAALTGYLRLLLLPFGLHMEYGFRLFNFYNPKVIAGAVISLMLLIYAIRMMKRDKIIFFSICWFFVALLPVSNIYPVNAYMAEHWLYLPSLGFFMVFAYGLDSLYRSKKTKLFAVLLILFILIAYSYLTIRQNVYWHRPIAFYQKTMQYAPNSVRLYHNLGKAYMEDGNYQEAIKAFEKAIEINPKNAEVYSILGTAYSSTGGTQKAIIFYQKAISINPKYADAYYNLGNAYLALNDTEKAIASYRKAIEIAPKNIHAVAYYNNLAYIYAAGGKTKEAIALYEKALEIDPGNKSVRNNIEALYGALRNKNQ